MKVESRKTGRIAPPIASSQKATGKRIAAFVFWILALACEVAFILTLNKTLYIEKNMLYWQLGFLIVDAILVIVGAQFWKSANDVDPASEANKLKFFLWKRSGLHLRDALACYYLYLSNEEIRLYENELDQLLEKYEVEEEPPF